MTSAIDATKPVTGNPTTASVRANFSTAASEISALQTATAGAPFLPLAGGTMTGPMVLAGDATSAKMPVTLEQFQAGSGSGGGGIPEAPTDGKLYGRQSGAWQPAAAAAALAAYLPLAGGTMTGPMVTPNGTAAAPVVAIGSANTGLYRSGTAVLVSIGGAGVWTFDATGATAAQPLNMSGQKVTNLAAATASGDALNLGTADGRYLQLAGGTVAGDVVLNTRATIGGLALPALAINGTLLTAADLTAPDVCGVLWNAYRDNATTHSSRYLANGYAASLSYSQASNGFTFSLAATGLKDAATSGWAAALTITPTQVVATSALYAQNGTALGLQVLSGQNAVVLNGGNAYFGYITSSGILTWYVNSVANFQSNLGGDFTIHGNCYAASYPGPSDARLKRDQADYQRGLAEIMQLRPQSFFYNGQGGRTDDGQLRVGVNAQDLQPIMPECVLVVPEIEGVTLPDQLAVDTQPIIFALVRAVQDLSQQVAALQAARSA